MPRIQAPLLAQVEQQHGALKPTDVTPGIILVSELWRLFRARNKRHRFAVQTLLCWYRSGEDVERRLPVLSTYLGHVHVADTYWYLSACPELMGWAVARLEQRWGERP